HLVHYVRCSCSLHDALPILALQMEHKLADLAIKRETLGFQFDTDKALDLIDDLTDKMNCIKEEVDPILPKKKMTVSSLNHYTPRSEEHTSELQSRFDLVCRL